MANVKLRIIFFSLAVLLVITAIVLAKPTVAATEPIAERCTFTQNYLDNVQKPQDLRARVDRLQAYTYIFQRLNVFVVRLEKNKQPYAEQLRLQLNELNEATESFKKNYENYDLAREAVADVKNCQRNFSDFQNKLEKARQARQKVHEDVVRIQSIFNPEIITQLTLLKQTVAVNGGLNE